ncbi:MAG: methionine synthase, partial [Chloroflexi bacterium]|nr:methionine synthase [Chloroflexota bacterium]
EKLYRAYLDRDFDSFPTTSQYAEGLHTLLSLPEITPLALKGQITGPITFGLGISDNEQRPILYDDTLSDVLAKFLHLKAAWQERRLKTVSRQTIIFVDEPSLSYFGSAFVSMSGEKVITLINEVLGGISGLKGIHCCSNTDWPTVLSTNIDIVNFDAYGFAREFSLYPAEVSRFIARGGCVAWGIVPNTEKDLKKESVASLRDRLDEAMAPFTRKNVTYRSLLEQALLTPSCGLAGLTLEASSTALMMLADLSSDMRRRHSL